MEEVWNEINLTSLHDHHRRRPFSIENSTTTSTFRGEHTLLDFLSERNNPPPPQHPSQTPPQTRYGSHPSPPAVSLRLNSPHDHFNSILQDPVLPISNMSCLDVSFESLASASSLQSLGKKRFPESEQNSGDRRHKRMIKNRESASRSRARKQAYTNELEIEVAHLLEENAKLKRQQQQLCFPAAAHVSKRSSLYRTSTAPF